MSDEMLAERLSEFHQKADRLLSAADKMSTAGIAIGLSMLVTLNLDVFRNAAAALKARSHKGGSGMNSTESAREENMLSAMRSGGNAMDRWGQRIVNLIELKLDASRASILSEWTDRDMTVGNVIYKAGSVTIADILDHAAREAKHDQGEAP